MLVDGPTEWAETSIPAGNKLDLLRHAYNARLGMAALPKDASVVLVRYAGSDGGAVSASDEVLEVVTDEVMLHPDTGVIVDGAQPDVFRYVSWSNGAPAVANKAHYVAVATVGRVEVWRVEASETLHAKLLGSHSKNRIRGVCWNSMEDVLLVWNDVSMDLIQVTADGHLLVSALEVNHEACSRNKTKTFAWSPCGTMLARSSEKLVDFYSWPTITGLSKSTPSVSSYRLDSVTTTPLLTKHVRMGSISAISLLSSSLCVIVSDAPLVLEDVKNNSSPLKEDLMKPSVAPSAATACVPSGVIDLTSLRITATSKSSLLNILDKPDIRTTTTSPSQKLTSHLTLVSRSMEGKWQLSTQIPLNQLSIPDTIDVESLRIVVGSTISNRIVAIHLDHSLKSGWAASVSGELELPDDHGCRGLRLAVTSPFVQVASTEKVKRMFFHASSGPQRIQLSKFKVPRRRRPAKQEDPVVATIPSKAEPVAPPTTSDAANLATILSRMEALQTLMVARFDHVEKRLDEVSGRLARLEVQKGQSL